jgi:hypothetical protein
MLVKIHFRSGRRVAKKPGKNRHIAYPAAALLKPVALMAYVFGIWRLASDMSMSSGDFPFTGLFSHWQVWMALGVAVHLVSYVLNRYGAGGTLHLPKLLSVGLGASKPTAAAPDGVEAQKNVRRASAGR